MSTISAVDSRAADSTTDARIVIISGDDRWVHIYPDLQTMLDCDDALLAAPGALDFFDAFGRRLSPVFSKPWALESIRATGEAADPTAVQARLCRVIEFVRAHVQQRLAEDPNPPGDLQTALARLPQLGGHTLAECFSLLEPDFGDGKRPRDEPMRKHDGSFWHNFWCH